MTTAIFFGSPAAAVPSLEALRRHCDVAAVVTQPDRPRGRSGRPQPPAVKVAAEQLGIDVLQPEQLGDVVRIAGQCDLGVLVAFGRLIKADLLAAPHRGIVNVHFSLLPRWRGAAPVERAILAGDARTGVTLMQMDEGLDTGGVLAAAATPIGDHENGGDLTDRLAVLGADLLAGNVPELLVGSVTPIPQDDTLATTAPRFSTGDARLGHDLNADEFSLVVRAFAPRPGAWGVIDGERVKVLAVTAADAQPPPGRIEDANGVPVLGLEEGSVTLIAVQPAGGKRMSGEEWFNGRSREPAQFS